MRRHGWRGEGREEGDGKGRRVAHQKEGGECPVEGQGARGERAQPTGEVGRAASAQELVVGKAVDFA